MLLRGEKLQLLPYHPNQWTHMARWFYDDDCRRMFRHNLRALGQIDFENYPQRIGGDVFTIHQLSDNAVVGFVQMIPDGKSNRAFYLGLVIDKQFRNVWYPTEAVVTLLGYAFNRMGFNKVIIEIDAQDTNLKQTLEATGFRLEGRLFQEFYRDGVFHDELRYCMLASDFKQNGPNALASKKRKGF